MDNAVNFVTSCMNFDGGFGCRPGSESHAGYTNNIQSVFYFINYLLDYYRQVYCCVGMLSITGHLHLIKADTLGWWLCERQLPSGGTI